MSMNIAQLRTAVSRQSPGTAVRLSAGTLLALLNLVRSQNSGADPTVTSVPISNDVAEIDLSGY